MSKYNTHITLNIISVGALILIYFQTHNIESILYITYTNIMYLTDKK